MRTVNITTPENIEIKYRLAATGSRITAAFIDYLIQGAIYLLLFLFIIEFNHPLRYLEEQNAYFVAVVLFIMALTTYGYFTILEMLMDGRTLGKKLLGIKTIRKNGQPIDIKHSLIRNLFRIFIDNYLVGILMIFFRKDHGRLGDVLSSTMVIEVEEEEGYDFYKNLSPHLEKRLTEDEKQLLITYLMDREKIEIGKQELQEKIISYFHTKYNTVDEEVVNLVKAEME